MKKNRNDLKQIGYWRDWREPNSGDLSPNLPWPTDFVDLKWDVEERALFLEKLKEKSEVHTIWRGLSLCRICAKLNGSQCRTDGVHIRPEGYVHYIEVHNLKPPEDFIKHILRE